MGGYNTEPKMTGAGAAREAVAPEDEARGQMYALIAKLLSDIPDEQGLRRVSQLHGDPATPLGSSLNNLATAAATVKTEELSDEFHDLFIGVGRGELLPYGSYYLTGFLHEKPLAALRETLAALDLQADPQQSEPEDHIASELEVMSGLILGSFGEVRGNAATAFYREHLQVWAHKFFADLEAAENANFYRHVAVLGRRFLELEEQVMEMN